jgi:hypothetical protein
MGVDWGILPLQKHILGRQSGPFQLKDHQELSKSILDIDYVDSFATGCSRQGLGKDPRH